MALLTGDLAKKVYAAFKGRLLTGLIRREAVAASGGLDAFGDPIDIAVTFTALQGFFENYDDVFRAAAGIPKEDVKVNIFAQSIPGIQPGKDDIVMLNGIEGQIWYQLREVRTDPATALWESQAFVIPAPEDAP